MPANVDPVRFGDAFGKSWSKRPVKKKEKLKPVSTTGVCEKRGAWSALSELLADMKSEAYHRILSPNLEGRKKKQQVF